MRGKVDIGWSELDKPRFVFNGCTLFSAVQFFVFPAAVLKVRLQANSRHIPLTRAASDLVRTQGVYALYRGFIPSLLGLLPSRALFVTTFEVLRERFRKSPIASKFSSPARDAAGSFAAGGIAAFLTQAFVVPTEVVTQRIIIRDTPPKSHVLEAVHELKHVVSESGMRGLFRGFWLSASMHVPSAGIWWSTYTVALSAMTSASAAPPEGANLVGLQAFSGIIAGVVSSTLTNPLDVCKTRMQLHRGGHVGIGAIVRQLVREDGLRALTKGLPARILNTAPVSVVMILTYEYIKKISVMM
jgi:hypothetical protein